MGMLIKSKFMWVFGLIIVLWAMSSNDSRAFDDRALILTTGKQTRELKVQVAIDRVDMMRGLMFRDTIAPYDGMLFDFGVTQPIKMWMKNTNIPLDMVFFDEKRQLVYVHYNAEPHSESLIEPPTQGRYVLELHAGRADELGLKTGTRFDWGD